MKGKSIRLFGIGLLVLALTASLIFILSRQNTEAKLSTPVSKEQKLIAHEWGTFTSIAGQDGVAIDWRPLNGASDLPKFVYTQENGGYRFRANKDSLKARIRMETPVIYFYTDKEQEVTVNVDFPKGKVTEWYPHARSYDNGINWGRIKLMPDANVQFLRENEDSHYYPARETDAVPLRVCGQHGKKDEHEKFLFYRGIGNFDLPLTAKLNGEQVVLGNRNKEIITNMIVFENRGGRVGFSFIPSLFGEISVNRPALNQPLESVLMELERTLIAQGLYQKEAQAMIKTWRDSWFEEGLRVFYILPNKLTDEILPLKIEPKPQEVVRVMVGRAEIITPEMEKEVKTQVGLLSSSSLSVRKEAMMNLQKHGRFYEPILKSILQKETGAKVRLQIEKIVGAGLVPARDAK